MVLGRFVNFNYLTLHYFARDRIADAYLNTEVEADDGAIKPVRYGNDLRLNSPDISPLYPATKTHSAPYHLIVTALNLQGSWHMKFKDRKSQHFIFSRYYCGSDFTGYVETDKYRKGLTRYSRAIAISGAAASPALGYLTFFAQAFMMTLLNVRLGLWMTNPKEHRKAWEVIVGNDVKNGDKIRRYREYLKEIEKAVFWPSYIMNEARGGTHERCVLVNLTDGGHTGDNGALYPLFQRRCQVIIAGDASRDPNFTLRDLFRVIHQVKTDLDIEVDIDVADLKPNRADDQEMSYSRSHFALGKITYPSDEKTGLPKETGWLLYFKPVITECDPHTLKHYHELRKGQFPHVSTLDQFFDEEQFEAYRYLGELSVERTLRTWLNVEEDELGTKVKQRLDVDGLAALIEGYYGCTPATGCASTAPQGVAEVL